MIELPNTPRGVSELLMVSIKYHVPVWRRIFLLILLLVIIKDASIYLGGMPTNLYLAASLLIIIFLLAVYLLATMLYLTERVWSNEQVGWRAGLKEIGSRYGRIVTLFLIFVLVPLALFALGWWITDIVHGTHKGPGQYKNIILVFSVGFIMILFYVQFFFTIPLVVMEDYSLWAAVKMSIQLCAGMDNWMRVFGLYIGFVVIWVLVSPDTLHGHFMKTYKVSALFDLVVFSVMLPIAMSMTVLVYNDFSLRKQLSEGSD